MKRFILGLIIIIFTINCYSKPNAKKETKSNKKLPKSPTKALFMGLIVPGSGDFYNKKYIKGTLFLSAGLFLAYKSYDHYQKKEDYYKKFLKTEDRSKYKKYSENYDKMQQYMYYYLINLAISTMDGVVESYLSDWHVDDIEFKSKVDKNKNISLVISKKF